MGIKITGFIGALPSCAYHQTREIYASILLLPANTAPATPSLGRNERVKFIGRSATDTRMRAPFGSLRPCRLESFGYFLTGAHFFRAFKSGMPSTYMTTASPIPVEITPNRYMGRYAPSRLIVVKGMV